MGFSPLKIKVLTDTHYYCDKNGTSGAAYDTANSRSQKLLAGSREVLESAFNQIKADNNSDIVLISGDVTNNGELNAHAEFIEMLRDLKAAGKKVYVITATHDFRDGGFTEAYDGDNKIQTPTASRDMLFDMYREFGPDEAISVHRDSMSFVVQLCDGYRLFALNDDRNLNGKSGFSDECFEWISQQAKKAKAENQFIIAMTHHPLIAPCPIYKIIGKGDMLGDYDKRLPQLADLGVQFMFTGHTHIHNTSVYQSERGNIIYDICSASPIGYPGAFREVIFDRDNNYVDVKTLFVETPDSMKKEGKDLRNVLENQLIGVIKNMIKVAGEDIDKFAYAAQAISIKPKLIYKIGWILKPIFKFINSLKLGTVAKWTKKETGLRPADYKEIKDIKVVDVISELVLNLFGGESKYTPETPMYKIVMGFLGIIDSILRILHIDLKKIIKVVPSASELVEPLLFNYKIDSYYSLLKVYPFISEDGSDFEKLELIKPESTVKKSNKGLPVIISAVVLLIGLLPLWLILLLIGFIKNQIIYGKRMK